MLSPSFVAGRQWDLGSHSRYELAMLGYDSKEELEIDALLELL